MPIADALLVPSFCFFLETARWGKRLAKFDWRDEVARNSVLRVRSNSSATQQDFQLRLAS